MREGLPAQRHGVNAGGLPGVADGTEEQQLLKNCGAKTESRNLRTPKFTIFHFSGAGLIAEFYDSMAAF